MFKSLKKGALTDITMSAPFSPAPAVNCMLSNFWMFNKSLISSSNSDGPSLRLHCVPKGGTKTQGCSRCMIVSFRDEWLRAFFVEDTQSRNIPPDLESRLFRKLQMIDDATTDQDLRVPPSNHFDKLRGNLAGFHSIPVNNQWRLVFRWDSSRGEAEGVYLDDQSYR